MTAYKVIVTKKADKDEERIYNYISKEFGQIYADKFRDKLIELFKLLSKQPLLGRPAKNRAMLRVYIFSKQNKLVYKVTENEIIILRLVNYHRQRRWLEGEAQRAKIVQAG